MDTNDEQQRMRWRDDVARISAQIDSLKLRIDSESRMLYARLSAEVAVLQSDLRDLQATVFTNSADMYARHIASEIEELRARGDAAYNILQASVVAPIDAIDAEIRRLEAVAASASGDARARILDRVAQLKAERTAGRERQPKSEPGG